MVSQPMAKENVVILTANGINLSQADEYKPANQSEGSLRKHLQAEVKVFGVSEPVGRMALYQIYDPKGYHEVPGTEVLVNCLVTIHRATIQIVCGAMVLSLGILLQTAPFSLHFTHVFSTLLKAAYPFIGALCFVISGSLSIITEKKSTKPLIQSSLAANFLSSLSALVGFILLSVNLALLGSALQKCNLDEEKQQSEEQTSYHDFYQKEMNCLIANDILAGVLSVMLIFTVLEFCLAVLMAMIWWKQFHSDFPGSVIFQPLSDKDKSGMVAEANFGCGYEKLSNS